MNTKIRIHNDYHNRETDLHVDLIEGALRISGKDLFAEIMVRVGPDGGLYLTFDDREDPLVYGVGFCGYGNG